MNKQSPSRSSIPQDSTLSKTALVISPLKQQFIELSSQRETLLEQIKSQRREWEELTELIQNILAEILTKGEPIFKQMGLIESEIHSLFARILKRKKLGKRKKSKILWVYGFLLHKQWISMSRDNEYWDEFFVPVKKKFSESETKFDFNTFNQNPFAQSPNTKVLRHTFLRLAAIFHPDKARSNNTKMRQPQIMQELNRAYQDRDIARLIQIEQQFARGESISIDLSNRDNLKLQCEKLKMENELLKEQYQLLKKELILILDTYEGNLAQRYRQAERDGLEPFSTIFASADKEIFFLQKVRDFVRLFCDKKITIQEFVDGPSREFFTETDTIDLRYR